MRDPTAFLRDPSRFSMRDPTAWLRDLSRCSMRDPTAFLRDPSRFSMRDPTARGKVNPGLPKPGFGNNGLGQLSKHQLVSHAARNLQAEFYLPSTARSSDSTPTQKDSERRIK